MKQIFKKLWNLLRFNKKNRTIPYRNNWSQEYLFIGGTNDGKRIFVPDEIETFNTKFDTYRKILLCGNDNVIVIYLCSNLTEFDALNYLVKNYAPESKKS